MSTSVSVAVIAVLFWLALHAAHAEKQHAVADAFCLACRVFCYTGEAGEEIDPVMERASSALSAELGRGRR